MTLVFWLDIPRKYWHPNWAAQYLDLVLKQLNKINLTSTIHKSQINMILKNFKQIDPK